MKKFNLQCRLVAVVAVMVLPSLARAQIYTDLFDLTQATGSVPGTPNMLAQGFDSQLYSTMPSSLPGQGDTVVASPSGGVVSVTHYFGGPDGSGPYSGLTLGMDGNFYGTTYIHTTSSYGEVF
jgi:hypothetical protein